MDYKDWTKLKQRERIDYLRTILEGGDGHNGIRGEVKDIDKSIGKLKQRMKVATLASLGSIVIAMGVKNWSSLLHLIKLFI